MLYGWAGTNLEIDLSRGNVEKMKGDPRLYESYLGGRGLASSMLWEKFPGEVSAFSPENPMIFAPGLLTGTMAPYANRTSLVTMSPVMEMLTYSNMGGFWGAQLKQAGYDSLVISGKSPVPVYISIADDQVEIRDASHLWNKDTLETSQIIQEELRNDNVEVLCIGQAGENLVFAASIQETSGSSFSRAGVGAVMGDKRLKAIAVYGTKDIKIAEPSKFVEVCEEIYSRSGKISDIVAGMSRYPIPTLIQYRPGGTVGEELGWEVGQAHEDYVEKFKVRDAACRNCFNPCRWRLSIPGEGDAVTKCEGYHEFINACKVKDFEFNTRCCLLCFRYGLDIISTAYTVAYMIDLYEKGLLTEEDVDGIQLRYGDPDLVLLLIEKIARKEGIGALFATGSYEAARQIGKDAEKHLYHVKKLECFDVWNPCDGQRKVVPYCGFAVGL
ncbi:aldehyde ferredoxin oxidoreductase N-terminal domain-containing protein, partial [Chloroflexota bacterium]